MQVSICDELILREIAISYTFIDRIATTALHLRIAEWKESGIGNLTFVTTSRWTVYCWSLYQKILLNRLNSLFRVSEKTIGIYSEKRISACLTMAAEGVFFAPAYNYFPLLRNPIIGTPRVFAPRILFLLRKEQLGCSKKALKQVIKWIDYLRHISAITGRFKIDYQQQGPHRDCPPQHKARCREFPLPQPEGTRDGYRRTRR